MPRAMKRNWGGGLVLVVLGLWMAGCATPKPVVLSQPTEVEFACGECLFHMKGDGCDLAVRVDGHAYYVEGVDESTLGDAHAKNGICSMVRRAWVTGSVKDGRFVATSFKALPATAAP